MIKTNSTTRFERLACAAVLLIGSSFAAGGGARGHLPDLRPLPALQPRNADVAPPRARRERHREQQFTEGQQVEVQLSDGIWRLATVIEPTKTKLKNLPIFYGVSLDAVDSSPEDDWKTTVHRNKIRIAEPAYQVGQEVEANYRGTWVADGTTIQKYDEHTGEYTVMLWGMSPEKLRAINIRSIRKFETPLPIDPLRTILGYAMYDRKVRDLCTDKRLGHIYNRDLYKSGIFVRENGISISGLETYQFFEMDGFYVAKKYKDERLWVCWSKNFYHGAFGPRHKGHKDATYFVKTLEEPRFSLTVSSAGYREHYLVAERCAGNQPEPVWTLCYVDGYGQETVLYRARPGVTEQDLRGGADCGWEPDHNLGKGVFGEPRYPRHTLKELFPSLIDCQGMLM